MSTKSEPVESVVVHYVPRNQIPDYICLFHDAAVKGEADKYTNRPSSHLAGFVIQPQDRLFLTEREVVDADQIFLVYGTSPQTL